MVESAQDTHGARRSLLEASAFLIAAAASFYLTGLRVDLNQIHPPASLASLIEHTAPTPFQYRLLVPTLVGWLARSPLVPGSLGLEDLALLLEAVFVFLTYLATRSLLAACVSWIGTGPRASFAALSLFYVLPFHSLLCREGPYWYPSDTPAILVFALGLLALRRGSWRWYYPLFALGTLNKETTLFLTAACVLTGWGAVRPRTLAFHTGAQLALWIAIKGALYWSFRDQPGSGPHPFTLAHNLHALLTPALLLTVASSFGFLWIPIALCGARLREPFVRRVVWVLAPFFGGGLLIGEIAELRIWGEMIPVVLLGVFAILSEGLAPAPPPARD
jgi:hypothetical protein